MSLTPWNRQEEWYQAMIDAAGSGGSSEPILVTISNNVASMTSTDIKTAISDGKIVYLRDGNLTMYEITTSPSGTPNAVVFTYNYLNSGSRVQINDDGSVVRGSLTAGTYSKPSGGIPESDLAQAVKDKLNKFVVTLTPTAQDYSGTMDKTVAEINAAYEAGQHVVFRLIASASQWYEMDSTERGGDSSTTYPSYNACGIVGSVFGKFYTGTTNDGTQATYSTNIYTLTASGGGVLVVTDTDGTLDKTWQEIHDAMLVGGVVIDDGTNALCAIGAVMDARAGEYKVSTVGLGGTALRAYSTDSASGYPYL